MSELATLRIPKTRPPAVSVRGTTGQACRTLRQVEQCVKLTPGRRLFVHPGAAHTCRSIPRLLSTQCSRELRSGVELSNSGNILHGFCLPSRWWKAYRAREQLHFHPTTRCYRMQDTQPDPKGGRACSRLIPGWRFPVPRLFAGERPASEFTVLAGLTVSWGLPAPA